MFAFFPVSDLKPEPKHNLKQRQTDQGKPPLPFPSVAALCKRCWGICIREQSWVMLAEKEGFGLTPTFTSFLYVHITVLGNCPRINTCLGNTFPRHPNLLLTIPMVEDFLLKNKCPAGSKWKIILNSYIL